MTTQAPNNFPPGVEIAQETFQNWALAITVPNLWTCHPNSEDQVVEVCNWAAQQGYTVRPRGIMHGWSPTTVATDTPPGAKILLVDLTKYLARMTFIPATDLQPASVQVQTGATMDNLLTYLESAAGPDKPGYSFPHAPAPGHLTVGGVLAIDAHGSAVPSENENFNCSYGSLSNQILSFKAVVTDPDSPTPDAYTVKTFNRGDADAKAFLAHLGRAFIVEATLQVIENYYLRCVSYTDLTSDVLFAAPTAETPIPPQSLAHFLEQDGRVEAIWFPFTWLWPSTPLPWFKVWSVSPTQPPTSRKVDKPYNYVFSDNLPEVVTNMVRALTSFGGGIMTPAFGQLMQDVSINGLNGTGIFKGLLQPSNDIWGPSKNTLLYVKDTTLRVTANGYAVQMKKADVQQAVHDFATQYVNMVNAYAKKLQFPINSPLEIRVTSLDDPAHVGVPAGTTAESPVISALSYDEEAKNNNWDVALWLDVLTLPDTPHSNDFYQELEEWIQNRFNGTVSRVMPEWSKGWAYTSDGPWTNSDYIESVRRLFTTGRGGEDNWNYEVATLAKYDKSNLFTNELLGTLFTTTT
jgi:Cholesterol oxidase, substrate-binding/FAD binding domain